jgi:hypothetical protein
VRHGAAGICNGSAYGCKRGLTEACVDKTTPIRIPKVTFAMHTLLRAPPAAISLFLCGRFLGGSL